MKFLTLSLIILTSIPCISMEPLQYTKDIHKGCERFIIFHPDQTITYIRRLNRDQFLGHRKTQTENYSIFESLSNEKAALWWQHCKRDELRSLSKKKP